MGELITVLLLLSAVSCSKINFMLSPSSNVTAVFLTCCGRYDYLPKTLKFFAMNNDYPLHSVIVINDGQLSHSLASALANTPSVVLINTGSKVGQVLAIDMAFSLVKTTYVYFSEDDMWLVEKGVIRMNVEKLDSDPTLLQVLNNKAFHPKMAQDDGYLNARVSVFSFNPGVSRMEVFRDLPGGFSGITGNSSFGTGAGKAEDQINTYFVLLKRYRTWQSPRESVLHAGEKRGLPRLPYA